MRRGAPGARKLWRTALPAEREYRCLAGAVSGGADRQRVTLPALMQDVHTCSRLGVPPTVARTIWMFGFQRRGVRRCE